MSLDLNLTELFDEYDYVMYDLPEKFQTTGSNKFFSKPTFTSNTQIKTNILENDDVSDEYNCSVFYYTPEDKETQ